MKVVLVEILTSVLFFVVVSFPPFDLFNAGVVAWPCSFFATPSQ